MSLDIGLPLDDEIRQFPERTLTALALAYVIDHPSNLLHGIGGARRHADARKQREVVHIVPDVRDLVRPDLKLPTHVAEDRAFARYSTMAVLDLKLSRTCADDIAVLARYDHGLDADFPQTGHG